MARKDGKRFENLVKNQSSVLVIFGGDYRGFGNIMDKLKELGLYKICTISADSYPEEAGILQKQYPEIPVVMDRYKEKYSLVLKLCPHIFEIKDKHREAVYIDGWQNILETEEEFQLGKNFQSSRKMFVDINLPLILEK